MNLSRYKYEENNRIIIHQLSKIQVIIEATEAYNRERRGVGVQMRSWLEAAPYAEFPEVDFVIARQEGEDAEQLDISADNVRMVSEAAASEAEYIDQLYEYRPDVIFFPLAAEKYARNSPVRQVAVDYGMEDLYSRSYIMPAPVESYIQGHKFALQHFDGIITVSETSKRDLSWFFPEHKDNITVVYPGVTDTPAADNATDTIDERLREAPYFLIIGYEHKKNIMRVAQAFQLFKERTGSATKLAIAGKPGYGAEEIDACVSSLPCQADIVRLGYVMGTQKHQLLRQARAMVALPVYEGFGISALEGMKAGKTTLVSDNGSLREIVGEAGYLADPFSVESMAEQLEYIDGLTSDPKLAYAAERVAMFDQQHQSRKLLQKLLAVARLPPR
jgi:glycosyltransferase involved in cell wall biosynthesis